jgi:N-acyl-D-aspartate/D-glutamate deacylase
VNDNPDLVAEMLVHPAAMVGNSDAGAHIQMFCAAGDSTLLLTRHVREREDMSLEQAVWHLTGRPADIFGFDGRGRLAPGMAGDLAVFDLDELVWAEDQFVDDLPGPAARLRRPPGGYRHTVVAGIPTQKDGVLTGATPGHILG